MVVMHYYEDRCVMECCGIRALSLTPNRAIEGMMDHGLDWAVQGLIALDSLIRSVRSHKGPVESDQNNLGDSWKSSEDAVKFLEELRASLSAAIEKVRVHGLRGDR